LRDVVCNVLALKPKSARKTILTEGNKTNAALRLNPARSAPPRRKYKT